MKLTVLCSFRTVSTYPYDGGANAQSLFHGPTFRTSSWRRRHGQANTTDERFHGWKLQLLNPRYELQINTYKIHIEMSKTEFVNRGGVNVGWGC